MNRIFGENASPRERRIFWVLLLLALLVRIGAALYLGNEVSGLSGAQDEVSYSMLGQRYTEGHGLTFPRPWYPWIRADTPQSYFSASMSLTLLQSIRYLATNRWLRV